ncbi:MAG: hypothetical protein KGJ60_01615 [Verrucomicrobiota bacterium]|nr:hypothetical protein [Verrucomicrobiota bacterium]
MKPSPGDSVRDRRAPVVHEEDRAFSRIELLVILATLALLAVTLLPALARTGAQPQGTQCVNNLRQITRAWLMYADDNGGHFPPNPDYNAFPRWAAGDMRSGGGTSYAGGDTTNTALLTYGRFSVLGPYVRNPALFKCPADLSTWSVTSTPGTNELPRVRSYSMNQAVGCEINGQASYQGHYIGHWLVGGSGSPTPPWRVYLTKNSVTAPNPSDLWVLLEEHPDSINDAAFAFKMPFNPIDATHWIDTPAKYHNNACNFSFADGHIQTRQWQAPQSIPLAIWAADTAPFLGNENGPSVPDDPDILWLAHHTTAPAPGTNPYYP